MPGIYSFASLSSNRIDDAEFVFNDCGDASKCWCSYWYRSNAEYKAGWGEGNRRFFRSLVRKGPPPGIIAYRDGEPAGWCGVAPRQGFDRLNRSKPFAAVDEMDVWSVNCFVVTKKQRRKGLLRLLLREAVTYAGHQGAKCIEGYPVDRQVKPGWGSAELFPGTFSAFRSEGFVEVVRRLPARPLVRKILNSTA